VASADFGAAELWRSPYSLLKAGGAIAASFSVARRSAMILSDNVHSLARDVVLRYEIPVHQHASGFPSNLSNGCCNIAQDGPMEIVKHISRFSLAVGGEGVLLMNYQL